MRMKMKFYEDWKNEIQKEDGMGENWKDKTQAGFLDYI